MSTNAITLIDFEQFKALVAERDLKVNTYSAKTAADRKRFPGLKVKVLTDEPVSCVVWDYQKPGQSLLEAAQVALDALDETVARINATRARDNNPARPLLKV